MNIGIPEKNRKDIVDILNTLLADEQILNVKTKNYHWNVVGSDFSELHKFFDEQYEELSEIVDEVAERTRALNGFALGSLKEYLAKSRIEESVADHPKAEKMIKNLLVDHETIIKALREDLDTCAKKGDSGTSDFLTGIMEQHEKMAWMLRSYLD